MGSHGYHPHCGCSECSAHEEAIERDEELAESYKAELMLSPEFIGEACPNDEEAIAIARALKAGDDSALATAFRAVLQREADQAVERRAEDAGCTNGEAAERLCKLYDKLEEPK